MITRTIHRPTNVKRPVIELEPERAMIAMAQDVAAMQARTGCRVSIDHVGTITIHSEDCTVAYATGVPVSAYPQ